MNEITMQRTPEVIGAEIRAIKEAAREVIVSSCIKIGRKLVEAKELLDHGEWGTWLKQEVDYSQDTANNLMNMYRKYGADQESIFGEANSEALRNLSYTQLVLLLKVPDEERDAFIAENNVEELSTRQLQQLIKEKAEAEERARAAKEAAAWAEKDAKQLQERLNAAKEAEAEALGQVERLRAENKELKERPVEVAVKVDEEAVERAAKEAQEREAAAWGEKYAALQKKLEKAEKSAEKYKEAAGKADAVAGDKLAAAEKEAADKVAAAEQEAAQARAELEKLQKELTLASPEATAFRLHFKAVQENFNELFGALERIQDQNMETAQKLTAALYAVLKQFADRVTAGRKTPDAAPLPGQTVLGGVRDDVE